MRVRVFGGAALILTCLAAAACDESLSDVAGPTPNLTPTFSSIQREIFETTDPSGRQACTNCHFVAPGRFTPGGLNLTAGNSYAALVNGRSLTKPGAVRVVPGDPENSYLVHKLEGRAGIVGARMPATQGPFLTDGQILIIKRWIENGAPND
jgi:hypothetical protein